MRADPMTATPFPQRLYMMLESEEPEIVSWAPSGTCFKVMNLHRFREETLPKYFRHTKITSFQRQLNLYGFARLHKGEESGCYFHAKFIRGKRETVREIRRVSMRPDSKKKKSAVTIYGQPRSIIRVRQDGQGQMLRPGTVGISSLSKNIYGAEKKKNLFSQLANPEECREAQFKSTFHQSAYPWRRLLNEAKPGENKEIVDIDLLNEDFDEEEEDDEDEENDEENFDDLPDIVDDAVPMCDFDLLFGEGDDVNDQSESRIMRDVSDGLLWDDDLIALLL